MALAPRSAEVLAFWAAFRAASAVEHDRYDVIAMGNGPALADELGALIVKGRKRATVSLARDYADGSVAHPAVDDHVVVVDGRGAPLCIWRTTEITVQALDAVDDRFAWDEGEGDRSRAFWLAAHRSYFGAQALREGFLLAEDEPTVFERFTVVWPPSAADPPVPR